eukprot:3681_1
MGSCATKIPNEVPKQVTEQKVVFTDSPTPKQTHPVKTEAPEPIETYLKINNIPFDRDISNNHEFHACEFKVAESKESLHSCVSIQRICNVLQFYQHYHANRTSDDRFSKISKYLPSCTYLINDYHHILEHHLNEDKNSKLSVADQFREINHRIMSKENNLYCDIAKCKCFCRNNRERENTSIRSDDKYTSIYIDLLDSIHCYFIHSVDTGYRIINTDKYDTAHENICNENVAYDKELSQLKAYLHSKRQKLQNIRGLNRIQNNKFMTKILDPDENDDEKKKTVKEADSDSDDEEIDEEHYQTQYSFGQRYEYWTETYNEQYYMVAKYCSLKTELLCNKICSINVDVFDAALNKSKELLQKSDKLKQSKSCIDRLNDSYGIPANHELGIQNVLSIVLYTDYDTLSSKFSQTFRKMECNETDERIRERHREYCNWSKILCETVNCWGNKMENINIERFYHGVSAVYFDSYIAQFNSPTSTTSQLAIATIFARNDGIILELNKYSGNLWSKRLRCFNCAFISYFGNEDERLFIQPPFAKYYYLE